MVFSGFPSGHLVTLEIRVVKKTGRKQKVGGSHKAGLETKRTPPPPPAFLSKKKKKIGSMNVLMTD